MEIETRQFEFAHGKKPRGVGQWAFRFNGPNSNASTEFAPGTLSYAEGKKWARLRAKELRAYSVTVLS